MEGDTAQCATCAHKQHESLECKARYRVTYSRNEEGDPCLCTHQAWGDPYWRTRR